MKNIGTRLLSLVIIALILIGISVYSAHTTKQPGQLVSITIGYIGPLSGPSAVLGMDAVKAIEIAVSESNRQRGVAGHEIRFVSQDDQYLTKNTVNAYRKMVDTDGARVIFVANYGGILALKEMAVKDGVVIIDPLDCNVGTADVAHNTFCIATETESIGRALAQHLIAQNKFKAAVMYSTKDQFMSLVADAFKQTYEPAGGKVVVESFNYDDADFKTQLTKIRATTPDGLVLLGHDETGSIMKQARDLGIKVQFLTTGTITSPGAQQLSKGTAEGTIFAFWDAAADNAAATAFTETFTKLVGRPPILPLTAHPAYDAAQIVLKVLTDTNGDTSAAAIVRGLLSVQEYRGTTGTVSMRPNGAAPIQESVYKLVKGVSVKI